MAGCERQVDLSRRRLSDATLAGPVAERMEAGDVESMTAGAHKSLVYSLERQRDERSTGYGVAACLYVVHVKPVCLKRGEFVRALMTHLRRCNLRLRHGPCARRVSPSNLRSGRSASPGADRGKDMGVFGVDARETWSFPCTSCVSCRRNLYNVHHLKRESTHGRVSRPCWGDQLRRKPAESACWRGDAPPAPLRNALLSSRKSTWLGLGSGLGLG